MRVVRVVVLVTKCVGQKDRVRLPKMLFFCFFVSGTRALPIPPIYQTRAHTHLYGGCNPISISTFYDLRF